MEHSVKSLYWQIKNKTISQEEAVQQMRQLFSSAPVVEPLLGLQQILADMLNMETADISVDAEWLELGLDQVLLTQLADHLHQRYHLELTPAQILAQGTLKGLAAYVAQHVDGKQKVPVSYPKRDQLGILTVDYLKKRLSAVLQMPVERLEADAPLEDYGIDSVTIMKLTRQLERHLGPLSKTLFFEYQTIQELADYLVKAHSQKLMKLFDIEKTVAAKSVDLQPSLSLKEREKSVIPQPETVFLAQEDGIAVIGLAGRYPGARDLKQFWENLQAGKDSITEISPDRWDYRLYFDEDKNEPGKVNSKWGGFIEGVDQFDPLFFNISPREAEVLDPQERLFLECVYETLEDAGYSREALRSTGAVGVFVGAMYEEYPLFGAQEQAKGHALALGSNLSAIANRVSYFFNLTGPSMVVNTMCSSSLTSLHLACQSILRGECELAIAGGVNLSIHPNKYLLLGQGNFASSNGRCNSFGQGGDGYVPGEGVGAVFLKPLAQAIRDRDHIYGVIKGTAVNHGGKTNGYTVPNPHAQAKVIEQALAQADVHPRTITYIEAHGTGTALGDPIEITGLKKAFDAYTADRQFCAIGSVKSNIGHCEGAAGIAGLTKVLLQMKYKKRVPSLHAEILNPHIDFGQTPFKVQQNLEEWKRPVIDLGGEEKEYPRRAGISAFGAGGSNAHVVIEEFIQEKMVDHQVDSLHPALIVLSAKDVTALQQRAERLLEAIESLDDGDLRDVAFTLQVGRDAMEERLALTTVTMDELKKKLKDFIDDHESSGVFRGTAKSEKAVLSTMSADDDMKTILATWLKKGKYDQLLQLWVKGLHVDWQLLYPHGTPRRISLPSYPFARQRYWFSGAEEEGESLSEQTSKKTTQEHPPSSVAGCMYLPVWEEVAAVSPEPPGHQRVVIVYEESAAALNEAIADYYHTDPSMPQIIQICLGSTTQQRATDHWECDIRDETAFNRCLADCGAIDALYYLAEHAPADDPLHPRDAKESLMRNELPLLRLLKGLHDSQPMDRPIDCYILTLDNYTLGEHPVNPYGGGVTGLVYAAAQGDHRLRVRNLDLSIHDIQPAGVDLIEQVISEPPSHRGEVIKLKQGQRYQQVFYEMDETRPLKTEGIREEGVYVIVGGSGAVGRIITRYLMADYGARVVWIGRTPEEDQAIQEKMADLRGGSGSLSYIQADVTDELQMKRAVERIKGQYNHIHGAIFSGVVFSFENSIRETTESAFLDILNVKAVGGVSFYSAFADEDLDFMLYFSSGQAYAFSGASRFSAYAAGVTFADSWMRSLKNRSRFPVGSINWGFWQSSVAGTFLEERTSALGDREGFDCFVRSVDLLTKGLLEQSLCLRPTPSLMEMMKVKPGRVTVSSPSTKSILHSLSSQWPDRVYQGDRQGENRLVAGMESKVAQLLFVQLSRLGLPPKGTTTNTADIINNGGISPKYKRWLTECLRILADHGYIHCQAGQVTTVADATPMEAIWQDWQTTLSKYTDQPDWKVQTMLLDACLRKLPDILTGRVLATDVLFSNSSMESVEGIYKGNAIADYFNHTLADVVETYVQRRIAEDSHQRIRIIEAGAGTGGTSAIVLERIRPYAAHVDYVYTDISKSFLLFAEEQYGATNPNLSFQTWDVEQPVSKQGIAAGSYDVLIASNVLHATRDIRHTLQQVKASLKPNGLILINEMTRKNLFATVTFGLLDGWWLFQDDHLRIEGSPLIAARTWQRVMEDEGFRQVAFLGEQGPDNGQRIIVAESDGWIRLPATPEVKWGKEAEAPVSPTDHRVMPQEVAKVDVSDQQIAAYVKDIMIEQLASVLKVSKDRISPDVAFSEYGVDSILGVAFVNRLNEVFQMDLNSAILFDYTSVHRLAEFIVDGHQAHIQNLLQDRSPAQLRENQTKSVQIHSRPVRADMESTEAIAVVGMSGQFPDATDVHTFWEHLKKGHDGVHELPADYLDQGQHYDKVKQRGKTYCKWGGILAEKNAFDPLFFNISPREAASMSPHQRLILQESWKALEDAGYNPKKLAEAPVGVFIGAEPANYYHESFTGSSDAIVASRLSYYLNLMGPAMVINTGCSSSAAAIHLACESLRRGESTLAIAGGVYAKLDATSLVALSGIDMVSPTGKCFTFDEKADGTVLSEGVGIVVLKPLQQAEADGDPIYGLIVGSGMNQDGASNGITAPNGLAQERLLVDVYEKYGIHPGDISYIEAHGTGTKLGDPIEVNALIRAFKRFTSKTGYCAIGSTKSSIGHTGAAAGVIGLMRVLLSMTNRQIPGLINFETLNPLIALQQSPFYINRETVEWVPPRDQPLLAAVNSFGHSGTNVHLVVQEYQPSQVKAKKEEGPVLIPLSAKKKDRLQAYVEKIAAFLEQKEREGQLHHIDLSSLAYTLQTGREAMAERVVFLVHGMSELMGALRDYCAGRPHAGTWQGHQKKGASTTGITNRKGEDLKEAVGQLAAKDKLTEIAQAWVQGVDVDWDALYGKEKPSRIHLPAYPFAGKYYDRRENAEKTTEAKQLASLHPLLQENTSNLQSVQFSSTFDGSECFLKDHLVQKKRMMPAMAYLEMARAAVEQVAQPEEMILCLQKLVWLQPFFVEDDSQKMRVTLSASKDGGITYDMRHDSSDHVIYHRGRAVFHQAGEIPILDIPALKKACDRQVLSRQEAYKAYREAGFIYGPSHQGMEAIYIGDNQVLARLELPQEAQATLADFGWHPGLMDSALQAALGLMGGIEGHRSPRIPFALEEAIIYGPCAPRMWSVIRYSEGSEAGDAVLKLDVDLCDEAGRLCARLRGFSLKALDRGQASREADTLFLEPIWYEQPVDGKKEKAPCERRLVLFCGFEQAHRTAMEEHLHGIDYRWLQSEKIGVAERYTDYADQVLKAWQSMIQAQPTQRQMLQLVIPKVDDLQSLKGLSAILKTGQLEYPHVFGQLIEMDELSDLRDVLEENRNCQEQHIRYKQGRRWVLGWEEITSRTMTNAVPFKNGGIYLITGGAGGLGLLFAKEIANQVDQATVVLVGRSPLGDHQQAVLETLPSNIRVIYQCADVTDSNALKSLISRIQQEYGSIRGIIHSAGVVRDSLIRYKTKAELQAVMAPKVEGLILLDQATQNMPLDFFLCFSSGSAVWGSVGQADYAAANAFMDQYMDWRSRLVADKQRHGRTLSINWPYWKNGGMAIDASTEQRMRRQLGLVPLWDETGMRAFYRAFALDRAQVLVMSGDAERMRERILTPHTETERDRVQKDTSANQGPASVALRERVESALFDVVAQLIHVQMDELDAHTGLDEYGFDSITFSELANQLNQRYQLELMPPVFFEHNTLHDLADYLSHTYHNILKSHFEPEEATESQSLPALEEQGADPSPRSSEEEVERVLLKPPGRQERENNDVAIVGMSGLFPGAQDLDDFWENLVEGKDCITEIPSDRWDWREYYGDPAKEANKTNVKWGAFINGVDQFDPLFFGISPRQAELMDPQQRLLMMYAWKAIEDAGYAPQRLSGTKTGIFVGMGYSGYGNLIEKAGTELEGYSATGMAAAMGPNRMSYFLNVHGPSEPIDTACSSSLVAIDRAVNAIQNGSCDAAIAGGVNLILTPELHISFSKANMLSEDGRCKTFSDKANGYVRGEGIGMIFLKKLEEAERAGDHIYGVIKGTAVNHGGRANSLTAPNPKAQRDLLVDAYQKAGIDPRTVTYIEAHGTGTELGDPIEINGLKAAFAHLYAATGDPSVRDAHCGLGSVKSNIGHLELAAGIAGVIKLLLQLKHKKLVKSLHADVINPYIQLKESPFYIVQSNQEWVALKDPEGKDLPRRAGVSSFGFGGANAHVVIEEYIPSKEAATDSKPQTPAIILLSAKDDSRLKEQAKNLWMAIRKGDCGDEVLADLAYTLQVGRDAMEERLGLLVTSIRELSVKLKDFLDGKQRIAGLYRGQAAKQKGPMTALQADDDFQGTLTQWWDKGKYHKLVSMWVHGLPIDWEGFYASSKPKRISLPTYPFAQERYWIQRTEEAQAVTVPPVMEKKIFRKIWRPDPAPRDSKPLTGTLIVLATSSTLQLIEPMSADPNVHIIPVVHGDAADQGMATDFYCQEAGEALYQQLKETIAGTSFQGMIDLTAYDAAYEQDPRMEWGKITFLQHLIAHHRQAGWKVMQVTYRLQSWQVKQPTLQGARLAGLYRMLGAEYQQTRFITMDSDCSADEPQRLWAQVKETFHQQTEFGEYCYRQGQRFLPDMMEVSKPEEPVATTFGQEDVILITGGSQGIGAEIAERVVRQGAKHLVIMGREALPEQSMWSEVITKEGDSRRARKLRRLKSLVDQGVRVHYDHTTLTDFEGLKQMVNKIHQQMGPITGVFHCAGAKGKNPAFIKKTVQEMKAVCDPKISGLICLHQALAEEPLAFFLLFSSVAGAVPYLAAGQSDYALANAYLDFYAAYQAGQGKTFQSIQWPVWKDTGMAADGMGTPAYVMSGFQSHNTADGLHLMEMVQQLREPVCMPCVIDPVSFTPDKLLRLKRPVSPHPTDARKEADGQGEGEAPIPGERAVVLKWLKQLFQRELKLTKTPDEHTSFAEYGVDSIIIAQIVQIMQEEVGQPLPPSLLVEHDNIAALADYLAEHHSTAFHTPSVTKTDPEVKVSSKPAVLDRVEPRQQEDLAIVGIASRFPDAPTKEAYWELLKQGKRAIHPVPESRWIAKDGRKDVGGWISGIDQFDPDFFHINPVDVEIMDPQARLLLEESLKTIYDAGYDHHDLRGQAVGVYIGGRSQPVAPVDRVLQSANPILGMGQNYLAANISKFFDFRGPSLVLDTACSSGMTGLQLAADALRAGRIDMALVGAVSLLLSPLAHDVFAVRNLLSQNGRFEIFDKQSMGEVLGEGIGVVMVKRLSDAIRDGNHIYGVVKGIAVNNDGRTLGPGSPSLEAQKQVMKDALALSGKQPQEIDYIEVNGGGTPIMDTIEIKALSEAYDLTNQEWGPVFLGATKPHIGHLLLASGMASFIRCLLSVYHGEIPPFLSAKVPFDHYDFSQSRIQFNRETVAWPTSTDGARTAALSSFADGGTNCHVIIESFTPGEERRLSPQAPPALQNRQITGTACVGENVKQDDVRPVRNVWGEIR